MSQKQVIFKYSNAEGMFWTNWMLLIKVHSQHPKNRRHQQQIFFSPLKKILYSFTGSKKPSTPSSVAQKADYVSPLKKQYWDVQTNNLRKLMAGMNKEYILMQYIY